MTRPVVARILARSLVEGTVRMRASLDLAGAGVERPTPGAAPTAFRIWRAGDNPTSKGDTKFTARSAKLLLDEQATRGNLYSIDVDHMSLSDAAPPEHHRAVGWHRLEVRKTTAGPELWAVDVEWSPDIRAALESAPPGFRYFSPAYDVARESGEVVGYLNTALTNNPATFNVTALATRAGEHEEKPMKMEDILAALKAAAEGDDEAQAKKAKAALAALTVSDDEKKEPPVEEKKKDSDADNEERDGEDAPPPNEKKDTVATSLDAKAIEKLVDAKLQTIAENAERDRLLASRKDVGEKVLAALQSKPLALVREMLDAIPVAAKRNPAADATVRATLGEGHGAPASQLPPEEKAKLDARMGLAAQKDSIVHVRNKSFFHAMTRDQAQRVLAPKGGK